jgi:hypothetical protein
LFVSTDEVEFFTGQTDQCADAVVSTRSASGPAVGGRGGWVAAVGGDHPDLDDPGSALHRPRVRGRVHRREDPDRNLGVVRRGDRLQYDRWAAGRVHEAERLGSPNSRAGLPVDAPRLPTVWSRRASGRGTGRSRRASERARARGARLARWSRSGWTRARLRTELATTRGGAGRPRSQPGRIGSEPRSPAGR